MDLCNRIQVLIAYRMVLETQTSDEQMQQKLMNLLLEN